VKRFALGGIALLVMVVAAGCLPPILPGGPPVTLPPPPGYQPPVIDSQSTSAPVHPGDQVSWILVVHDDQLVSGVSTGDWLTTPEGENFSSPCSSAIAQDADVTRATVTVTCTVPTIANNGIWQAFVSIADNAGAAHYSYPGLGVTLLFTVVGGSDDHSPPQFVSSSTNPTTVHPDTKFTLTMQFTDQSGVSLDATNIDGVAEPNSTYLVCDDSNAQITTVGMTTTIEESCSGVAGHTPLGQYSVFINVTDGLGHWVGDQIDNITVT
jgi:hypothetical protein